MHRGVVQTVTIKAELVWIAELQHRQDAHMNEVRRRLVRMLGDPWI